MLLGKKDFFIYILLAILFTSCSENQSCKSADVVLINSTIYTLNDSAPNAQAVAFLGDTLVFKASSSTGKVSSFLNIRRPVVSWSSYFSNRAAPLEPNAPSA